MTLRMDDRPSLAELFYDSHCTLCREPLDSHFRCSNCGRIICEQHTELEQREAKCAACLPREERGLLQLLVQCMQAIRSVYNGHASPYEVLRPALDACRAAGIETAEDTLDAAEAEREFCKEEEDRQ